MSRKAAKAKRRAAKATARQLAESITRLDGLIAALEFASREPEVSPGFARSLAAVGQSVVVLRATVDDLGVDSPHVAVLEERLGVLLVATMGKLPPAGGVH